MMGEVFIAETGPGLLVIEIDLVHGMLDVGQDVGEFSAEGSVFLEEVHGWQLCAFDNNIHNSIS